MRLCLTLLVIFSAVLYIQGNTVNPKKANRPARNLDVKANVIINNQTYYFGINDAVEWNDAYARCDDLGMQLLTLDSVEKEATIFEWIGLNSDYDTWLWTAGHKPRLSIDWQWITPLDNLTINYFNWGFGQPSRTPLEESCMNFASWYGWDDDPCMGGEFYLWEYVCEEIPV